MKATIANALRFMGAKTEVLVAQAPEVAATVAAVAEPAPQA